MSGILLPAAVPTAPASRLRQLVPTFDRWVRPGWSTASPSTAITASGTMYGVPYNLAEDTTFTDIGLHVTTAGSAGALARIGLYTWASGEPEGSALHTDFGTVLVDTTGAKLITQSIPLAAGWYIAVAVGNANYNTASMSTNAVCDGMSMGLGALTGVNGQACITITGQLATVAGGLPSTLPAPTGTLDPTGAVVALRF